MDLFTYIYIMLCIQNVLQLRNNDISKKEALKHQFQGTGKTHLAFQMFFHKGILFVHKQNIS